jgi:alcohol dehydrogenase
MDPQPIPIGTNLISGQGSLEQVAHIADQRVLLVTDLGIVAAGHVARLEATFAAKGTTYHRFDGVRENPDEDNVDACVAAYKQAFGADGADWIVALGGGSSIDVAKGCSILANGGGRMRDYVGRKTKPHPQPPVIAIPTTAGTGSEVQSFALITNTDTGRKMACGGEVPRFAILDPDLTRSQPRFVAICAGLDTLAHSVETAVTTARTEASVMYSREAFRLVERNFETILSNPDDLAARSAMLRASAAAGIAIENSMLGAAHSMANPLTRQFGVVHGQAVGQLLPFVVRFNAQDKQASLGYAELAYDAGLVERSVPTKDAVKQLIVRLRELVVISGFERAPDNIPASAIDALSSEAAEQWTAQFNPQPVDEAAFRSLFAQITS